MSASVTDSHLLLAMQRQARGAGAAVDLSHCCAVLLQTASPLHEVESGGKRSAIAPLRYELFCHAVADIYAYEGWRPLILLVSVYYITGDALRLRYGVAANILPRAYMLPY